MIRDSFHIADLATKSSASNRICSDPECYIQHMDHSNLETSGARLRWARTNAGFGTAKAAARAAGVGEVNFRAWENDQHGFAKHVPTLSKVFRVDPAWLLSGEGLPKGEVPHLQEKSVVTTSHCEGIEFIPKVDISYAMGAGTVIEDYPETTLLPFTLDFLRRFTRGSTDALFIASGHGDSMEPTIRREDLMMVDTTQVSVNMNDQVWALTYGGGGMIKRLRRLPDDRILIMSDNPSVSDFDAHLDDVHIIGKVVWIARIM